MSPSIAVVGASWRSASTLVRARLSEVAAEPLSSLRESGYVAGAACISTCSRTEWVLTADQPEWAGNLLRSALAARLPELEPSTLTVRAGASAVNYLLRVAVGLDSVAEGEGAVGRQVLRSFEHARASGMSDRRLRHVWKHVERLIHLRRDAVPASRGLGVQTLVREVLQERGVRSVAVIGRGDFGLAMERGLKLVSGWDVTTWTRQTMDEFHLRARRFDAVVVCTGAAHAWLELPEHAGFCVDTGSPPQVRVASGWSVIGLDALLSRPERALGDEERERLEQLVSDSATALSAGLQVRAPSQALAAIDAERAQFLNQELPSLLTGLSPAEARRVRRAVSAFTHKLIQRTREATS